MMMSEVLEGCDGGRIIAAMLTVFELRDAENWCLSYTNAGYTQEIRLMPEHSLWRYVVFIEMVSLCEITNP
jgi:hypothetical protein